MNLIFVRDTVMSAMDDTLIMGSVGSSIKAKAMLLAIALQESDLVHRQQLVGAGQWWRSTKLIAAGYWMFEEECVRLLLEHKNRTVGPLMRNLCDLFDYPRDAKVVHQALVHNDILAAAVARLLLYTVPTPLPDADSVEDAWEQYLWAWRPGKPRREDWDRNYYRAWNTVMGDYNAQ